MKREPKTESYRAKAQFRGKKGQRKRTRIEKRRSRRGNTKVGIMGYKLTGVSERRTVNTVLPLTLPVTADSYPGIEVIGQQIFWLVLWNLLPRKTSLHLRGTGTSLAEGPAELP